MGEDLQMKTIPRSWVSSCGRYTVTISDRCLGELLSISREHAPREVGSSLVGSYSKDGFRASVLGSAPLPSDSRGRRFTFSRGVRGLRRFFLDLFTRTRGRRHYVGEWHSHPGGPPMPSRMDDRNQTAIARDKKTNCPECILLIIGGDFSCQTELCVYVYSRTNGRIELVPG